MKFEYEKQAKDALDAAEAWVNEKLTDARLRVQNLNEQLAKLNATISILQNRANALRASKVHWVTPISISSGEPAPPSSTPSDALKVITSILESSATAMRARTIAQYAHKKGLIASSNGLDGVIRIVSNKLSLNSPEIFTNTGWGWWELTSRTQRIPKRAEEQPTAPAADGPGGRQVQPTANANGTTMH